MRDYPINLKNPIELFIWILNRMIHEVKQVDRKNQYCL